MGIIYGSLETDRAITVGNIAASSGIKGRLDLGRFVSRHSAIVGSTGAGKSNLMAVLLEAIATQGFPAARVLVIDPHGEYGSAVGQYGRVFKINPDQGSGELPLHVPYWALPFDELQEIVLGDMQPGAKAAVRDEICARKQEGAASLSQPPPSEAITADSPIPFSIKKLWFDLDDYERQTFSDNSKTTPCNPVKAGDASKLISNEYPPPNPGNQSPFAHPRPRNIRKQLELMRSRLQDTRYSFLLEPGKDLNPDLEGKTNADLHQLVSDWVGHDNPITVLDVSGLPSEVLGTVVGTMVHIVYDLLYWAFDLPISGRSQPLLIVLDEAHVFLPEGKESPAHRIIGRVAKEGRKYGVGLSVVSQRPGEIDSTVLSQVGTLISLRLTNATDRSKVEGAMPDDLGGLAGMLPSLRTGEGIVLGESMPIPSRIRFAKALRRPQGDDPLMPEAWRASRPEPEGYKIALRNWRHKRNVATEGDEND